MKTSSRGDPRIPDMAALVGLLALALGWLIPNKAFPWLTIWNESASVLGLLLLFWGVAAPARAPWHISWPVLAFVGLSVFSVWLQRWLGLLDFAGDAWMLTLYLGCFLLAVLVGGRLAGTSMQENWVPALLVTVLASGVVSVGLMLSQWLLANPPVIFAQELTLVSRPYGNIGQQNHADTLLFLAICAALQLHVLRRIGNSVTILCIAFLSLGMAITQSRTGLLQMAVLLGWSLLASWRGKLRGAWCWGAISASTFAAWWIAMRGLDSMLLLPQLTRDIGVAAAAADLRWPVWQAFFDAASRQPLWGYGWLQSSHAHEAIAACHPGLRYYFHYTHLLPLDLVIWTGFPLGVALSAILMWWFFRHWVITPSIQSGYFLVALTGLLAHAFLEYPQAYLYFLIPAGLYMGIVDHGTRAIRTVSCTATWVYGVWAGVLLLCAAVAFDAFRAIELDTKLRFEEQFVSHSKVKTSVPKFLVLDQHAAMYALRSAQIGASISDEQLSQMRKSVERLPLSSSILRFAIMLGYSGHGPEAAKWQQMICDMYSSYFCERSAARWVEWQAKLPGRLDAFQGRQRPPHCQR